MGVTLCYTQSCALKLLNPVRGGSYLKSLMDKNGKVYVQGDNLYLDTKKSLEVRATENCTILNNWESNGAYFITAKGNVLTTYYNLAKSSVSKGDFLKRGQILGELFSKDSIEFNYLEISIMKDGKHLRPNW